MHNTIGCPQIAGEYPIRGLTTVDLNRGRPPWSGGGCLRAAEFARLGWQMPVRGRWRPVTSPSLAAQPQNWAEYSPKGRSPGDWLSQPQIGQDGLEGEFGRAKQLGVRAEGRRDDPGAAQSPADQAALPYQAADMVDECAG